MPLQIRLPYQESWIQKNKSDKGRDKRTSIWVGKNDIQILRFWLLTGSCLLHLKRKTYSKQNWTTPIKNIHRIQFWDRNLKKMLRLSWLKWYLFHYFSELPTCASLKNIKGTIWLASWCGRWDESGFVKSFYVF